MRPTPGCEECSFDSACDDCHADHADRVYQGHVHWLAAQGLVPCAQCDWSGTTRDRALCQSCEGEEACV